MAGPLVQGARTIGLTVSEADLELVYVDHVGRRVSGWEHSLRAALNELPYGFVWHQPRRSRPPQPKRPSALERMLPAGVSVEDAARAAEAALDGESLEAVRLILTGMGQKDAAERLGWSQTKMCRVLWGATPGAKSGKRSAADRLREALHHRPEPREQRP